MKGHCQAQSSPVARSEVSRAGRRFGYAVYTLFAKHLPATNRRRLGRRAIRALRRWCGRMMFDFCGEDVNVEAGADFGKGRGITIGSRSGIGIRARLDAPLSIGDNVMMGPDVLIFTGGHAFATVGIPMIDQGAGHRLPVSIGNDVWIGERAIIMPGVIIGDGAVIGAGAVVRDAIPALGVAIGNPAKVVGFRDEL